MEIIHVLNMGHKIFFVQCIEQLFLNIQILFHLYIPPEQAIEERDAYSETSEEEVCALFLD